MLGARIADRYRLDRPLGAGGMGSVFRATDERLDRPVAVKLLLPELATDLESIARFEREARTTAKLTHPGIVQTLDFGSAPSPTGVGRTSFLVMELAEGETLAHVMARAPLPLNDVIAVGLQILSALGAAHAAGVVHRDLKPENVMISRGGDGHVNAKLLDFGLAQIKSGTAYTRLTQTGAVLGTPRYMAPEQARGEPCDARTDVYAAGLVLHAALTGRAPYDAESIAGIVTQVLELVPPRLDTVNLSVPVAMARAIETAIQKAPAARFASSQAFAAALEQTRALPAPVTSPEAYAATGAMPSVDIPIPAVLLAPQPAVAPAPGQVFAAPPASTEPDADLVLPRRGPSLAVVAMGVLALAAAAAGAFVVLDPMHLDLLHPLHVAPPPHVTVIQASSTAVPAPSSAVAASDPPPSSAPAPTHVSHEHDHGTHVPTTIAPPSSTLASTIRAPLIPVCQMAVHCCDLVSTAHEACRTQPIGGADAPPGGDPAVCPIAVRSYHDVLVAQHLDASDCVWPPSAGHALAAPEPDSPPSSAPTRECAMATHCCLRTGGTAQSCERYGAMPDAESCLGPLRSYHTIIEARGEDASDCVFH